MLTTRLICHVTGSEVFPLSFSDGTSDYNIFGQDDHTHFWGEKWKTNTSGMSHQKHLTVSLAQNSYCTKVPAIWALTHGWIKPVMLPCTTDQKQLNHLDKNTQIQSHERQTKTFSLCMYALFMHCKCVSLLHASFIQTGSLSLSPLLSSYLLLMSVSGFSSLGRMATSS